MSKILVVDDEESIQDLSSAYLEKAGYEVVTAGNGREALQILAQDTIEVIITDIIMPDMEGLELITILRERHPEIGLIACSGGGMLGADDYLTLAGKMGVAHTFPKPIDYTALIGAVEELLTS